MRKLLMMGLALTLRLAPLAIAGGVGAFYYWYASGGTTATLRLAEYCDAQRPGTPVETARKRAEDKGFEIMLEREDSFSAMASVLMYHRTFCEVSYTDGEVTATRVFTMD
ncbi:MAG: hypothetical protein HQK87_00325 [Nitrospinae bacterium]|nr:hypothetical protein [Nitrospinota bacterium]